MSPHRGRRQQQIDKSRQLIAESYFNLVKRYPEEKITVAAICAHAEVGRQTFYRHFSSKKDVIKYELEKMRDEFFEALASIEQQPLTEELMVLQAFRLWKRDYGFMNTLIRSDEIRPWFMNEYVERWKVFLDQFLPKTGRNRYETDFIVNGISGVFLLWIDHDMAETPEEIAALIGRFSGR